MAYGPGNVVLVLIKSQHLTEVFASFGERHVPAEVVADNVATQVQRYLKAGVPVASYLADQLLLPMALSGAGEFSTLKPSSHTTTNIEVIKMFMATEITLDKKGSDCWHIGVGKAW
ncbi:MAG: hypothetical protein OEY67_01590 [Gammaproteobacteria bacterium]|nr:hypothetical protein [Gammaproteobacteria bacterium]